MKVYVQKRLRFLFAMILIKIARLNDLLFLKIFTKFSNIKVGKNRFLRADILRRNSARLAEVMHSLNFKQDILIKSTGDILVVSDGILLNTKLTNRYFKVSGKYHGNEALVSQENNG